MTTGACVTGLHPSPPFPCSIDVLFRPPFIRLEGNEVVGVMNRVDGTWHTQMDSRLRMRIRGGVARGTFRLSFPALSDVTYVTPAAAVLPVDPGTPKEAVIFYLTSVRKEVDRA